MTRDYLVWREPRAVWRASMVISVTIVAATSKADAIRKGNKIFGELTPMVAMEYMATKAIVLGPHGTEYRL